MDESTISHVLLEYGDAPEAPNKASPVYRSLQDGYIRLLKLLPADADGKIRCEISEFMLSEDLEYTALSYTWGAPPDVCKILLNGYTVLIRKNLWRFLRSANDVGVDTFGLLWIDALCIDQADNHERMQQVSLMPHIFKTAQRVIAWLGPSYGRSDEAMDSLARTSASWRAKKKANIRAIPAGIQISFLCKRSYWTRLWIFQEIMLAKRIWLMCGAKLASWEPFRNMILELHNNTVHTRLSSTHASRLESSLEYEIVRGSSAMAVVAQTAQETQHTDLFNLMIATQYLRCAEQSDKVYALLGVAGRGCEGIEPDYDLPITVLLNRVLRSHHRREPPKSLEQVERQCGQLTGVLNISLDAMFSFIDQYGRFSAPRPEDVHACPLNPPGSSLTLWWAMFYNHRAVEDLMVYGDNKIDLAHQLKLAVENGNVKKVKPILQIGAYFENFSKVYGSILYDACWEGQQRAVEMLVRAGANVNAKREPSGNALEAASFRGHKRIVEILLSAGANINAEGRDRTALQEASVRGHKDIVEILLHAGADVNARGGSYGTALQRASVEGHKEIVEILLRAGSDVNARNGFRSALQEAASLGHERIVEMLIQAGADVNTRDGSGGALRGAAYRGYDRIVETLIGAGAIIDIDVAIEAAYSRGHAK